VLNMHYVVYVQQMSMSHTVLVHGYQTLECSLPETGQAGTKAGTEVGRQARSEHRESVRQTQEHHERPSPGRQRRNMQENQE